MAQELSLLIAQRGTDNVTCKNKRVVTLKEGEMIREGGSDALEHVCVGDNPPRQFSWKYLRISEIYPPLETSPFLEISPFSEISPFLGMSIHHGNISASWSYLDSCLDQVVASQSLSTYFGKGRMLAFI